jgi:hypothetical protein
MGRLGAAKRRMLSLAERPSLEVAVCWGTLPWTGSAEGIVAVYVCASIDCLELEFICEESVCTAESVGARDLVHRVGGADDGWVPVGWLT